MVRHRVECRAQVTLIVQPECAVFNILSPGGKLPSDTVVMRGQ